MLNVLLVDCPLLYNIEKEGCQELSVKKIRWKNYRGNICRNCLNRKLGTSLERKDCIYDLYPHECWSCRELRNIVVDLTMKTKVKLLFK